MARQAPEISLHRPKGGIRKSKPKALTRRLYAAVPVQSVDERGRGLTLAPTPSKPRGSLQECPMATAAAAKDDQPARRFAKDQLKAFVERVERLEEEKKAIADDIRDVYAEAKGNGYDVKTLRVVVRLRKQDVNERKEQEAILETYMHALGMLG